MVNKTGTVYPQMKGSVRDSVRASEFDMKHLKWAKGHIGRNVEIIAVKMKSIVQIFQVIINIMEGCVGLHLSEGY